MQARRHGLWVVPQPGRTAGRVRCHQVEQQVVVEQGVVEQMIVAQAVVQQDVESSSTISSPGHGMAFEPSNRSVGRLTTDQSETTMGPPSRSAGKNPSPPVERLRLPASKRLGTKIEKLTFTMGNLRAVETA
jgi:hypothetical protein